MEGTTLHLLSVRRCAVSILQSAGGMMDHTYKVRNTDVTELTMTFQKDMLQKECEDLVLQAVTRVLFLFVIVPHLS